MLTSSTAFMKIVRQAQAHPNMRILLACRKFDLDNDRRLRKLAGSESVVETVDVGQLAHETVREVVSKFGLAANSLNSKQLDLLSVPLHLKLLSELAEDEKIRALNFEKAQDLYEHFWKHKEREVEKRLDRSVQWTQVVYALCDHMHEHQTLKRAEGSRGGLESRRQGDGVGKYSSL